MLNQDQRSRLKLLRTMSGNTGSRKEAKKALIDNYWDTSMALEWIHLKKENPEASLEEFHKSYDIARSKAAVLPSDRYDLGNSAVKPNRQQRRAEKKAKNKKKK